MDDTAIFNKIKRVCIHSFFIAIKIYWFAPKNKYHEIHL